MPMLYLPTLCPCHLPFIYADPLSFIYASVPFIYAFLSAVGHGASGQFVMDW